MNYSEENLLFDEIVAEIAARLKRAKAVRVRSAVFDQFWGIDVAWDSYPHEARIGELCRQHHWRPEYRDWGKEIVLHRA